MTVVDRKAFFPVHISQHIAAENKIGVKVSHHQGMPKYSAVLSEWKKKCAAEFFSLPIFRKGKTFLKMIDIGTLEPAYFPFQYSSPCVTVSLICISN